MSLDCYLHATTSYQKNSRAGKFIDQSEITQRKAKRNIQETK